MKLHEIKITIDMLVEKCPRIHLYISLTDLKKKENILPLNRITIIAKIILVQKVKITW